MGLKAESAVPSKISNGRLIKQLELWGWVHEGSKGDAWTMANPRYKTRLHVVAPQVHKGNTTANLREVYGTVTGGDAEAFWARKAPANIPMREAVKDTMVTQGNYKRPRRNPTYEVLARGDENVTGLTLDDDGGVILFGFRDADEATDVTTVTDTTDSVSQQQQEEPVTTPTKRERGAAAKVLQYFHDHPHDTMTAGLIARRTGMNADTISGALAHLARLGHVERLVRGTYRLNANLAADKTVRHEHSGGVEVPKAALVKTAPTPPPVVITPPTSVLVAATPPDEGDDLDALLELILPEGYTFHPSHIKAMRHWQEATANLLSTLRSRP